MSNGTHISSQPQSSDPQAAEKLLPLVYDDLRRIATQKMVYEKPGQTLTTTALVHDRTAFLDRECGGDAELSACVQELLRANDAAPLPHLPVGNEVPSHAERLPRAEAVGGAPPH